MYRSAQAGRSTNKSLIKHPGTARRTHERLIIESRSEKRGGPRIDCPQVDPDRGPRILPPSRESFPQLSDRRGHIRFSAIAVTKRHQTIWFFDTRGQKTARPVILEAATDQR